MKKTLFFVILFASLFTHKFILPAQPAPTSVLGLLSASPAQAGGIIGQAIVNGVVDGLNNRVSSAEAGNSMHTFLTHVKAGKIMNEALEGADVGGVFGGAAIKFAQNFNVAGKILAEGGVENFGIGADRIGEKIVEKINKTGDVSAQNIEKLGESSGRALKSMLDPFTWHLIKSALGVAGTALAFYLLKEAGTKYIKKYYYEPTLIGEQSNRSWMSYFFKPKPVDITKHMVIDEKLAKQLNDVIQTTVNIKQNGGEYDNVLLHGLPGTGKTLFAQLLAKNCGMDYAIIPAANVSQFLANGTAVEELNNLFSWAERSGRGTVIFFDECETFLGDRRSLSLAEQNALNAFLAKTGTPSSKIMIIGATNRPEILDSAILDRFGSQINFPLPDEKARIEQLEMHIKTIFGEQKGKNVAYTYLQDPENIKNIAQKLSSCSGRTIRKFVNHLRQSALAQNELAITQERVEYCLEQTVNNRKLALERAQKVYRAALTTHAVAA